MPQPEGRRRYDAQPEGRRRYDSRLARFAGEEGDPPLILQIFPTRIFSLNFGAKLIGVVASFLSA